MEQTDLDPEGLAMANATQDADQVVDRAIRAMRDYQKGNCTTAFCRAALRAAATDLIAIATATRVPVSVLTKLMEN